MAGSFKWHGEEIQAQIRSELVKRVQAASLTVWNHAKELVNTDGTEKSKNASKRDGKGRFLKGSGRLVYGANPSAPGEPPHKQTGRLLGSVAWEVDKNSLVGRVGTNLDYGRFLELGTQKMAARPWLRRALREMTARVKAILSQPIDGPR
jgi:HK97 gp10 family phage protein